MRHALLLLMLLFSLNVMAHDRGKTEQYRDESFGSLMGGYQFANTWVIGKYTGSYTQILSRDWSLELEYAGSERTVEIAGFELGELKEERYTLIGKYYVGNSFFVGVGPFMYKLRMETDRSLNDLNGNPLRDTWELEGYGAAIAFGSRWQNKWGLTWGVDWIRMNVPLKDGKVVRRVSDLNDDDTREVKRSFTILRTVPTFTFIGVSIGYTF